MLINNARGKDYNFFSDLHTTNSLARNKTITAITCLILLVVIVGGFYVCTELKAHAIEKDISDAKNFLNSPDILKKRQEYTEKKTKYELMNKYYSSVEAVALAISNSDKVKSNLLQKVMTTVPWNVTFNTMSVSQNQINIQGVSANRVTLAEFYHNLDSLGLFKDVYISSIQKDTATPDSSLYNIQCTLKDVIKP